MSSRTVSPSLAIKIFFANRCVILSSYYLGDMLTQAGVTDFKTQLQVNVILSCWSLVVAVIGSLLMDVVGRRTMTLTAIGGMIVTLYIFGGLTKGKSLF